ncbi:hypothetical protein E8E13_000568 [Curvularia kusanoi]|uniref:Plastocyanin-like domain-containing protein n=1 Tax=Curvularia kusanoi TaxID=90978 RepID=A0A9P4T664_CURKU|nr:hypothetical protein E8E13_000568 [Curvularia kusanoi]
MITSRLVILFLSFVGLVTSAMTRGNGSLPSCAVVLDGKLPSSTPSNFQFSGNVRRYYIAAEETEWDYAPTGWDNWLGVPFEQSPRAQFAGYTKYGTKWLKALYKGYTDASFTECTDQPAFQGSQGPTIRAEVGDLIEILFVNQLRKNYATMHSMGLAYTKSFEGSDYPNNTTPGIAVKLPLADHVPPAVEPQNCAVYKWVVNDSAGPPAGTPAKIHSYHSYVSLQEDANAGLIGPTIIYARGAMNKTMSSYREFPILYNTYDESVSWLSAENKARLDPANTTKSSNGVVNTWGLPSGNNSVWGPQLTNFSGGRQFGSAPTFYSINGYVYSNTPTFEMCLDDNVIWGFNIYGAASHVFHMHGNGLAYNDHNQYAESGNDGVGKTLYTTAVGEGMWQVICHVQNHLTLGMLANYRVYPKGQCPLPPLTSA